MTATEKLNKIKSILETNLYKDLNTNENIEKYLDELVEKANFEIPREHMLAYKLGAAEAIINYIVKYILGDIKDIINDKE